MERYPNINILLNLPEKVFTESGVCPPHLLLYFAFESYLSYGKHYEGTHLYYGLPGKFDYPLKIYFQPETAEFS